MRVQTQKMYSLHDYTRNNDVVSLKAAIQRGANVNTKNEFGWTPLHLAVSRGYPECAKLLLEANARVEEVLILKPRE